MTDSIPSFVYGTPRAVESIAQCHFYHAMEVPGHGVIDGPDMWDLRPSISEYLGNVNFSGRKVLECGPASGFCTFWMEGQGADVVACDLSRDQDWDVVPFARYDTKKILEERRDHIDRINNAWWFAHRRFNSKAKVVYGRIYDLPGDIGSFDIVTMCQFLGHLRDPLLAMQVALSHCKETAIINGTPPRQPKQLHRRLGLWLAEKWTRPHMYLIPTHDNATSFDTYWNIPEPIVRQYLAILGFGDAKTTYHFHKSSRGRALLYTIVARRTVGAPG